MRIEITIPALQPVTAIARGLDPRIMELILKPGRLTEDEWQELEIHEKESEEYETQ